MRVLSPRRAQKSYPLSSVDLGCDMAALIATTLFLLVPYKFYYWTVLTWPRMANWGWLVCFILGYGAYRIKQEIQLKKRLEEGRVYVDFARVDHNGRVLLNSFLTLRDLERHLIRFEQGKKIYLYGPANGDEKKEIEGTLVFDEDEKQWVVEVE